jgi:membrane associated rhomboid family serine protease
MGCAMGFQDRDYYRGEAPANPLAGSIVLQLIVVNVLVFLANLFLTGPRDSAHHDWIVRLLELRSDTIYHPLQWYRLLTYGFTHDPRDVLHIGFNMFGLYIFGRRIDEKLGSREFLLFYLIAIVACGLVWSLRSTVLGYGFADNDRVLGYLGSVYGASGGLTAVVILFCLCYPHATILMFMLVPTPAWLAGLIFVAIDMFGGGSERIAYDVHLAGAAFAAAYWYFGWNFGRLPGVAGMGSMLRSAGKSLKRRPDLRVHDPGDAAYEELDAEGDRLLEKVHREGEKSLTPRERDALEAYSRRMRQKLR